MAANLLPIIAIAGAAFLLMSKKGNGTPPPGNGTGTGNGHDIGDDSTQPEYLTPGPRPSEISVGTLAPGTHSVALGATNLVGPEAR